MINYTILNEDCYPGSIKRIKALKDGGWSNDCVNSQVSLTLTYEKCKISEFQIQATRAPFVEISFYLNDSIVDTFQEKTKLSEMEWADHQVTYFQRTQLKMGFSNEAKIKLLNDTNFSLIMGLKFVMLSRNKADTPAKTRPVNLSQGQEYTPTSANKLESASKSPHNQVFKSRQRETQKKQNFKVDERPRQPTLKEAVSAQKSQNKRVEKEDDEFERVLLLSKQTEEQERRRRQLEMIEQEERTVVIPSEQAQRPRVVPGQQKLQYNPSIPDRRQLALLRRLNKEYKQQQMAAQIEYGVQEQQRISRLISAIETPFQGELFVLSGYEDPQRAEIVRRGKSIGMKYSPDVTHDCYLVTNFSNTPKVTQAKEFRNVTIVDRKYIDDCFTRKERLSVDRYLKK